jgi:hypothetical protein
MPTKSIRLSDDEAQRLRDLGAETGEPESVILRRAALRGLQELRLERGLLAYLDGASSAEGAAIAGLPRAAFLDALAERGIVMLRGPSTLASELDALATLLGNSRLAAAAAKLTESEREDPADGTHPGGH